MDETIAFLGLGTMGGPMAGHLHSKGFSVRVWNRTPSRADAWRAGYGGETAPSAGDAARGASILILCVGGDDDVRQVLAGSQGVLAMLAPGSVVIDHSTTSARLAREVGAACAARDVAFLDAPVSGGEPGAKAGRLTVMCGGDAEVLARVEPVIRAYAATVKLLGATGSGQLAKMVNQICIAGLLEGLAEGLHFARAVGLDPAAVVEVISRGAAQSWQMENRSTPMIEGRVDFGFAVDWVRKDLGYALEEGRRAGARLPVTALVDQLYGEIQAMGGGRWDTSSLLARLERDRRASPDAGKPRSGG